MLHLVAFVYLLTQWFTILCHVAFDSWKCRLLMSLALSRDTKPLMLGIYCFLNFKTKQTRLVLKKKAILNLLLISIVVQKWNGIKLWSQEWIKTISWQQETQTLVANQSQRCTGDENLCPIITLGLPRRHAKEVKRTHGWRLRVWAPCHPRLSVKRILSVRVKRSTAVLLHMHIGDGKEW